MNYIVIKELRAPTKVAKNFYIMDFFFVIIYFTAGLLVRELVIEPLHIPFFIFNTLVGIILVSHSRANPGKHFYETILYWQRRESGFYKMVLNVSFKKKKEIMKNELGKE